MYDHLLTIATLFKVISELVIQAKVEPVPHVVARLVANFRPLEDDLNDHIGVHRGDAEPENVVVPALCELDQSQSECCLAESLSNERSA